MLHWDSEREEHIEAVAFLRAVLPICASYSAGVWGSDKRHDEISLRGVMEGQQSGTAVDHGIADDRKLAGSITPAQTGCYGCMRMDV